MNALRPGFASLDTLFLDVGNTVVSMDFEWIARLLSERGARVDGALVQRAEARARPSVSRLAGRAPVGLSFEAYLGEILAHLPAGVFAGDPDPRRHVPGLVEILWEPGRADRLWRRPMPGVAEALERLHGLGLRLVAVSNSDGTAAKSLEICGVRELFEHVVDSHEVGFEKPDARIFEVALQRSGARPEQVVHVGDMPYADLRGARAAGLAAVLLDPYGDFDLEVAAGEHADVLRVPDLAALAQRVEVLRR